MSDNEFGPVDLTGLEPDKLIAKKWEDRLEEAKQYFNPTQGAEITEYISTLGRWLVSELDECKDENLAFNHIFDLQQPRLKKAQSLWQKETGRTETIPDLGELLDWLMGEMGRQRKHRKWAVKEAEMQLMRVKIWRGGG